MHLSGAAHPVTCICLCVVFRVAFAARLSCPPLSSQCGNKRLVSHARRAHAKAAAIRLALEQKFFTDRTHLCQLWLSCSSGSVCIYGNIYVCVCVVLFCTCACVIVFVDVSSQCNLIHPLLFLRCVPPLYIYIYICVCVCTRMRVYVYVPMCECVCVCVCVCACACACTHRFSVVGSIASVGGALLRYTPPPAGSRSTGGELRAAAHHVGRAVLPWQDRCQLSAQ
jgi:hypothetical protein